ncbi:MAG: virulence RhuM family protein [Candidatus Nomurabacteria bacterium]|jgi:hypothetical protein|nr:virulence RhuM family protein [Candidatus Nomurabacteria bacterium]
MSKAEPYPAENHPEIVIYQDGGVAKVDVKIEGDSVWLTQAQLVELYDSSKANVSEHIKNIFADGELDESATVRKIRTVQTEGKRQVSRQIEHYNLDMIISLGYRINSQIATKFRQWATARLHEYIVKGFTMDDERLKGNGGGNYWKELLDRIRDIRSSEKALYRQVLDLYALSVDYNPKSEESIKFFKLVQNKLHYAVSKQTAAEIVFNRADAEKDFMGLTVFRGDLPELDEVRIAKNYLTEDELFRLNRLVSAFFDLAEVKARSHAEMKMRDWVEELDKFTVNYGKGKLLDAGKISHQKAIKKAEQEYRKYQVKTMDGVERAYLDGLKSIGKIIDGTANKTTT